MDFTNHSDGRLLKRVGFPEKFQFLKCCLSVLLPRKTTATHSMPKATVFVYVHLNFKALCFGLYLCIFEQLSAGAVPGTATGTCFIPARGYNLWIELSQSDCYIKICHSQTLFGP